MMLPLLGCPSLRREGEAAAADDEEWLAGVPLTAERSFGSTTGRGKRAWKMGAGFNTQPSRPGRLSFQMTMPGNVPLLPRRRFALEAEPSETTLPPRTMDVWGGLQPRPDGREADADSNPPPPLPSMPLRAHTADVVSPGSLLRKDRQAPATATEATAAVSLLAMRREAREAAAWRRLFRAPPSRARRPSGGAGDESSAVERSRGAGDSRLEAERARPPTVRLGCFVAWGGCVVLAMMRDTGFG